MLGHCQGINTWLEMVEHCLCSVHGHFIRAKCPLKQTQVCKNGVNSFQDSIKWIILKTTVHITLSNPYLLSLIRFFFSKYQVEPMEVDATGASSEKVDETKKEETKTEEMNKVDVKKDDEQVKRKWLL